MSERESQLKIQTPFSSYLLFGRCRRFPFHFIVSFKLFPSAITTTTTFPHTHTRVVRVRFSLSVISQFAQRETRLFGRRSFLILPFECYYLYFIYISAQWSFEQLLENFPRRFYFFYFFFCNIFLKDSDGEENFFSLHNSDEITKFKFLPFYPVSSLIFAPNAIFFFRRIRSLFAAHF